MCEKTDIATIDSPKTWNHTRIYFSFIFSCYTYFALKAGHFLLKKRITYWNPGSCDISAKAVTCFCGANQNLQLYQLRFSQIETINISIYSD